jgi:hypothetical protein
MIFTETARKGVVRLPFEKRLSRGEAIARLLSMQSAMSEPTIVFFCLHALFFALK